MTCMKKLTALLVSAALALSLLAGCGGSKALSQVIADLLSGMYNNVTVEVDPDLTAALKKAAAAGSTQEEVLAALVEELNLSGVRLTLRQLQEGQQGDRGVELVFQPGADPDAAARSAVNGWASAFGALPDDGSYRAHVSMIEAENGYYIAVDVEVLKAGSPDKDDPVTLTKIVLSGIYKTEYIVDETFDKTGLTVTAYYSNNTSKVVDNYSISPSGALTVQDDTVTITYEEYGQTASATISIAVTDPGFKMNGDTYEVYNADGLKAWAEAAKVDSSTNCTLTANIDLENQPWTPIGTDSSHAYTGTFDGNDKTISGLKVESDAKYVGLFGYVGSDGTVQNLTLDSPAVSSTNNYGYAGAVAGHNNGGAIENCHVTGGSISGNIAGGVVGINERDGSVIGCSSSAKVNGTGGYTYAGGVVGTNSGGGTVTGCSSTGTVTGNNAGGVVGLNSGTVTACYHANGQVEGYTNAGGVVGFNVYKVTACYWSGNQTQGIGDGTQAADPEYSPSGNNGEIPPKNKVPDGTTWEAAVEAMNAQGTGYTFGGDMNNPTLTKK